MFGSADQAKRGIVTERQSTRNRAHKSGPNHANLIVCRLRARRARRST